MKRVDRRLLAGWIAVILSTIITTFWAFWGIVENFHEGWYHASLLMNVGLMFLQYLSPMVAFTVVTLISIFWPRFGAALHGLLALVALWFFQASSDTVIFLLLLPLAGLGALYWYGRPQPRGVAMALALGLPLLTLLLAGFPPAMRVSQRFDDGNLAGRPVVGNGVTLIWAPAGPGWPREGTNWHAAGEACRHLSADGLTRVAAPQQIWRMPTVDETVRSMARRGHNSGGVWHAATARASYETTPDKESPLWDVHSQVIYWWTATDVDEGHAFMIAYDGQVWPRAKDFGQAYLGFRCVRRP